MLDALHKMQYIAPQHHLMMFLLQTLLWWLFNAEASPASAFFLRLVFVYSRSRPGGDFGDRGAQAPLAGS